MTALNFMLSEEVAIISMDTLSLRANDHKPYKFVSKIFPLPHMDCVICGTGNLEAIINWFSFVNKNVIANGIHQLDLLTRQSIVSFMAEHNGNNSCTIYQFGLNEIDDKFHGFAYRSSRGFSGEEIDYGLGVKPQDAFRIPDGQFDQSKISGESAEEILANIMHQQKASTKSI